VIHLRFALRCAISDFAEIARVGSGAASAVGRAVQLRYRPAQLRLSRRHGNAPAIERGISQPQTGTIAL
jgi:hypothetical protein